MSMPEIADARLAVQRTVLENGLILLTSEQRSIPMVAIRLQLDAGSRLDGSGKEGLANLTSRLLTYGTRTRNALQISETLDFIGASLSAGAGEDSASVTFTLLKKDLDVGLNLLADILSASTFPLEEIDRQKQAVTASIKAKSENPGEIAEKRFFESLFPQSPYGRLIEGTEESVRRLERPSLVEFHKQYYRPNRSIMAVVGDISHDEMIKKLAKAFQPWEKGTAPKNSFAPPASGPAAWIRVNKSLTQANIVIGHDGITRSHPDYYAVQVMNYILGGGGFSSRMMDSIRNDRGLAYSVYSQFDAGKHVGSFQVVMQTKNETAQEAIRIANEEIKKIREKGVTEEELKAAKDYLIGSFPMRIDTNRRIAQFLTQVEYFDLGLDYMDRYPDLIRRVTRKDIARVAKTHLQPDKNIVVLVADQDKVESKPAARQ
jgi:zinc protease